MENIKIIDHFLSDIELQEIMKVINDKRLDYGHSSGDDYEKFDNKFFSANELGSFFNEYIKTKLEITFFKKFKLDRNYMHIQLYGQDGSYHIDNTEKNTFTFCIYITDIPYSEMENADGDFLLKIPHAKHIICINTIMNRGVFFPSDYIHKGLAYNRFYEKKRLCITWKLTEIFDN